MWFLQFRQPGKRSLRLLRLLIRSLDQDLGGEGSGTGLLVLRFLPGAWSLLWSPSSRLGPAARAQGLREGLRAQSGLQSSEEWGTEQAP